MGSTFTLYLPLIYPIQPVEEPGDVSLTTFSGVAELEPAKTGPHRGLARHALSRGRAGGRRTTAGRSSRAIASC